MKKWICVLVFAVMPSVGIGQVIDLPQNMSGITALPSTFGPGLGYRAWVGGNIGYGIEVVPSWEFDDVIARIRGMYSFRTGPYAKAYGLLTVGYMSISESSFDVTLPTFAIGGGYEKFVGMKKNKSWSIEAGYQMGSGTYKMDSYFGGTYEGTYDAPAIYIGGNACLYFSTN